MAVMAIDSKELVIAEEACAAIARYDKVEYIRHIQVKNAVLLFINFISERTFICYESIDICRNYQIKWRDWQKWHC